MPERSEILAADTLRNKIIGLGEKSIRKSYYPELQRRIVELESSNARLLEEIAERKRSQEAVRAAEDKYRALFQTMTEMVALFELVYDAGGEPSDYRCLECNDSYVRNTGFSRDETEGYLYSELVRESSPPHLAEFAEVVRTGAPFQYKAYNASLGRHYTVSVVSPGPGRFATIATDITDIKKAEEAIAVKNGELENYLYVASHDLRAPLVNIQGFSARLGKIAEYVSDLLDGVPLPEETAKALDGVLRSQVPGAVGYITTNVSRMDRLISGLLQISRTGRIAMTVRRIDMNALLRGVLDGLSIQIERERASVELGSLPDCFGDEGLLVQLFENLVVNALKYRNPERDITIRITGEAGKGCNVYRVADTGIGIAQDHLSRIWDIFFRVDWVGAVPGEGIGLSIAKRITEKHGGRIWVESEAGAGSSFFVELPAHDFHAIE